VNRVEMMDALTGFNEAFRQGQVVAKRLPWNEKVFLHQDQPQGTHRFTYVRMKGSKTTALAVIVPGDPVGDTPCFHLGYAVDEDQRGKGLATDIAAAAIEDMRRNMGRLGMQKMAFEAIIDRDNPASAAVARKVLGCDGIETKDSKDGKDIWQFIGYFTKDDATPKTAEEI
jgi:RimJ/RimL family protein N-acetyltransferase